jgi:hypothetical protein
MQKPASREDIDHGLFGQPIKVQKVQKGQKRKARSKKSEKIKLNRKQWSGRKIPAAPRYPAITEPAINAPQVVADCQAAASA